MKTLLIALSLFLSAGAFGQAVQITDNSPSGSPLSFKGTITFGEPNTEANCSIIAHNNGRRSIVASVVLLDVMNPEGKRFTNTSGHDHFFAPDEMLAMMAPAGRDFNPEYNCGRYGHEEADDKVMLAITPQTPWMTVTARMVQFDDGSVWGDPTAAKEVMFQRNTTIAYLQSLKASSNLTEALAQEPPLNDVNTHLVLSMRDLTWAILADKTTPQAQADELNRRLAIAQERSTWIK